MEFCRNFANMLKNIQIHLKFQKLCNFSRKIREISGIYREIQSRNSWIQSSSRPALVLLALALVAVLPLALVDFAFALVALPGDTDEFPEVSFFSRSKIDTIFQDWCDLPGDRDNFRRIISFVSIIQDWCDHLKVASFMKAVRKWVSLNSEETA